MDGEVSTSSNTIPDPISPALACRVVKPNFELSCKLMFERELVHRRHGMARHSEVHRAFGDSWSLTGIADGTHSYIRNKAMELEEHHGPTDRNACALRR